MKNYGHTKRRTHAGANWRTRFRASCLVWCEVAAFLLLVRMRFLFGFSSRDEKDATVTITPMCPSSQTPHQTAFAAHNNHPPEEFQIDTTRSSPTHIHPRTHTHTHRLTSFHREPQLTKAAEQQYLTSKHQTTRIIREPQQRRSTPERKSSREQHQVQSSSNEQQRQTAAAESSE